MPYRAESVVDLVDSKRAGEFEDGFPVVASVADALAFAPTTALVGVATQGGRFPPAWRALLRDCIAAGRDIASGLHECVSADPERVALATAPRVTLSHRRDP